MQSYNDPPRPLSSKISRTSNIQKVIDSDTVSRESSPLTEETMMSLLESYINSSEDEINLLQEAESLFRRGLGDRKYLDKESKYIYELGRAIIAAEEDKINTKVNCYDFVSEILAMYCDRKREIEDLRRAYKFELEDARASSSLMLTSAETYLYQLVNEIETDCQLISRKEEDIAQTSIEVDRVERDLANMRGLFLDLKRIEGLKRGEKLLLFNNNGKPPMVKWVQLDRYETKLSWGDPLTRELSNELQLKTITEVTVGHIGVAFEKVDKRYLPPSYICFTVWIGSEPMSFSVLDDAVCMQWVRGFHALLRSFSDVEVPSLKTVETTVDNLKFEDSIRSRQAGVNSYEVFRDNLMLLIEAQEKQFVNSGGVRNKVQSASPRRTANSVSSQSLSPAALSHRSNDSD